MRKLVIIVAILGLALSACQSGTTIGKDFDPNLSDTIAPSASPKPSKSKPAVKKTKEPSPTPTQTKPAFKANVYTVVIRASNNYYEFKGPGFGYRLADQGGPRVFVGDIIIFKNMDERGLEHSFTSGKPTDKNFGSYFDSKLLKPGKTWKWTVDAPVGQYTYNDRNVQYISGGPLDVVARS